MKILAVTFRARRPWFWFITFNGRIAAGTPTTQSTQRAFHSRWKEIILSISLDLRKKDLCAVLKVSQENDFWGLHAVATKELCANPLSCGIRWWTAGQWQTFWCVLINSWTIRQNRMNYSLPYTSRLFAYINGLILIIILFIDRPT